MNHHAAARMRRLHTATRLKGGDEIDTAAQRATPFPARFVVIVSAALVMLLAGVLFARPMDLPEAPEEPAIAEQAHRTVTVSAIEGNCWQLESGDHFRQFVFWTFEWIKPEKRWSCVDRGWCYMDDATLHETNDGWAVEVRGVRVEAPMLFWSWSNFDPEIWCRTASNNLF